MASWPPRWRTVPGVRRSRGGDVAWFVENLCRVTKDSVAASAGSLLVLDVWQRKLLVDLFAERADGRLKHRTALVGMARKNGKSALGSGIGLWGLLSFGDGAEVYSCAGDRDQARIVFGGARRMVELEPELSARLKLYRDAIEDPVTGSVYRVLSAEAYTKEGLNPNLVLFDEVHVQPNRELWDVMQLAGGSRPESMQIGITTAGVRTDRFGQDSLCYGLYQYGRRVAAKEIPDPTFYFAWWEPKKAADADHTLRATWREANPGLGTLVKVDDFESVLPRTPEAEFRTKRCNQWVSSAETALPAGLWSKRAGTVDVTGKDLIVMVDGSWSGDSTGIVAATIGTHPGIAVVGLWERPVDAVEWRVPMTDVKVRIVEFCRTHSVRRLLMDPFRWQSQMVELADEGLPVEELPNTAARAVTAWKVFYDLVLDGELTHDGDAAMTRHVDNMRLKIDAVGARPVKEHRASQRHIDLGICAMYAAATARTMGEPVAPMAMWLD